MLNHYMQHYVKKLWKCFIFKSNFRGNSISCMLSLLPAESSIHPFHRAFTCIPQDGHSEEEKENSSGLYGTAVVCFNSGVMDSAVGQNSGICSTAQEEFGGFRLCRFLGHLIKHPERLFWQEFNGPYVVFMKKNV